jgi:hypothetical protein
VNFYLVISDIVFLQVENHQPEDIMAYKSGPKTDLQRYLRLNRNGKPIFM